MRDISIGCGVRFVVPTTFRFLSAAWSLVAKKVEEEKEHDGG